jgi:hypothetical protein
MVEDNDVIREYEVLDTTPVDPEPAPTPDPAPAVPDWTAKFEEIKAGYDGREAEYKQALADQQAKLDRLEGLVQGAYANAHATTPDPEPEQTFTKEDLVKDPVGTLERVSDAKARKALQEYSKELQPVMNNLVERGFQGELAMVSQRKYYPYVKDKLSQTFESNPQLKGQAGAVEYAYRMLVGENIEEIEKSWEKANPGGDPPPPPPTPPVEAPIPSANRSPNPGRTAAPTAPAPPKNEPQLTAEQLRVQAKFKRDFGLDLSAKDLGVAGGE